MGVTYNIMAETKRTAIVDKEWANKLVNIVESTSTPWVFGIVAVWPDGGPIWLDTLQTVTTRWATTTNTIGIGTVTPNASSLFDVTSTTKGFLPPRMTTAQRDAIISPAAGLVIYNTTTANLNVFTTVWTTAWWGWNVTKVGTPVNKQLWYWTWDWTLAGATNLEIDNNSINFTDTVTPAIPTLWHRIFNRVVANRNMPAYIWPSWLSSIMQPFLARNKIGYRNPPWNLAINPWIFGFNAPITTGFTLTARNVATTNYFTRMRRNGYVTSATAWEVWQWRHSQWQFTVGDPSTSMWWFLYILRFGISDAATVAGARMFMWLRVAATPANVDPSTLLNCIWLWHNAAHTNMHIFYGGTTAQTPIDLWVNFPITANSVNAYELALFSSPSNWDAHYQVTRLETWDVASWTITNSWATVLPTNTSLLLVRWYRTNNATALAVSLDVMSAYIETDF